MRAALPCLLLLAGCQQGNSAEQQRLARQNDTTILNPPGRYQMLNLGPSGLGDPQIVVLDTRYGNIARCAVHTPIECSAPVAALPNGS